MFIQFGYVVLFSSAFPLAAMCALINNIIEIRSDALKLCTGLQRPFGQRVENIGQWQVRVFCFGKCQISLPCYSIYNRASENVSFPVFVSRSTSDCNGGNGLDSHHSKLLPDWSVWADSTSLPMVESGDDHYLHCLTGGTVLCTVNTFCP